MSAGTSSTLEFLAGGGEMGALIRAKDWSTTPLGAPDTWPQSLKTCVRIVLTSSQPMFVWWGEDLINLYNDAYRSIVGGKHPQALGQPASVVWHEIWDEIGPRAETAMRTNVGTYDEALLLIMERNGYPEETYYTFSYSPVPGDDGGTGGILCANTDDTRRVVGERQLHTLRELGKITTASQTLAEVFDKTGLVLRKNAQDFPFLLLYQLGEEDRQIELVEPASDEETAAFSAFTASVGALLAAGEFDTSRIGVIDTLTARFGSLPAGAWAESPRQALLIPIAQSGQARPFAVLVAGCNPYRQLDESYLGFFGLVADQVATSIANVRAYEAERRRTEALREIDRAKTTFFSNVSHEFRTPLTLMLGPIEEALKANGQLPGPIHENLQTAHRNALRLQKLVNSLLDFSRIEAGRLRASYAPTDLAALTADLASNFRSVIERAGMSLVVDCPPLPEAVFVDREMWEKIILNLLSNAFKYTLDGQITVSLRASDGSAELRVHDTGVGIPTDELPRLFERFHRVAGSRGRSFEGTGIGLSLIKELVNLHGGTIAAESEPGLGSTFTVRVPLGKAHLPGENIAGQVGLAQRNAAAGTPTGAFLTEAAQLLAETPPPEVLPQTETVFSEKKAHVVVADDNADMRAYVQRLLEPHYRVSVAPDGQVARWLVAEHRPDLVLSDVMMPVMDGLELLKTLKADPLTATIPVVLLSARAGEEAAIEGYEAGADDYLVKPFSANELLARVRAQLNLARMRSENERRLQNLFVQAPVVLSIVGREPDFVYRMANAGFAELVDRPLEAILGKTLFEVFPELRGQGFDALLTQVATTGEPYVQREAPLELVRNGKREALYFDFMYHPVREPNGEISGVMGVSHDVTSQVLARRAIEESERLLRAMISQTPLGVAVFKGPDLVIELANEVVCQTWGRTRQQVEGLPLLEALPELRGQGFDALLLDVCKTGKPFNGTETPALVERNGALERVLYDFVYEPIHEPDGRIERVMVVATDVTNQVQARQSLEASNQQLQTLFEQAPVGIALVRGLEHRFELVNDFYVNLVGRQRADEIVGKPLLEALPEIEGQGFDQLLTNVVQTGEPFVANEQPVQLMRNGQFETVYADFVYQPLPAPDSGVFAVVTDVTESVMSRQKTEENEERLRLAIEAAELGTWEYDPQADVLTCSARAVELVGFAPGEIVTQQRALEAVLEADRPRVAEAVAYALRPESGGHYQVEYSLTNYTDGRLRTIQARGKAFFDENGAPTRFIGTALDVTEERRAEEALRESEEKYRSLFESIDEGYCIIQMLYGTEAKPVDWRFLEVNPAFEKQNGLTAATGKTIRELAPTIEAKWMEIYGRVAETGESIRFEEDSSTLDGRVFDLYAFRVGDPDERKVAVLFNNITDRKRREANVAFLADVGQDFARFSTPDELLATVGAKLGAHLGVSACLFSDIDEANDEVRVDYAWETPEIANLRGVYRLSDFVSDDLNRAARAGESFVVGDTQTDPRTSAAGYGAYNIHSFITVPARRNGEWKFLLTVNCPQKREWRRDEIELVEEVAARVFPRLGRARAEAALRDSEEKFRALADNISQLAWMTDANGWIFWYNQRWFDYTGTTLEQMQGWGWQAVHAPDEVERVTAKFKHHIASGESWEDTFPLRSKEGEYRWFLSRAVPIRDAAGQILHWFGTNTDITEAKRAEAALRESDRWFRQLADSMPQIVWTARPDGFLDYYNRRWYELIDNDLGFGDSGWLPILHPDDRQPCLDHWQRCLQTGEPYQFEFRLDDVRHPGNYRWFLARATAFRNEHHAIIKWFGTCTDIHDQKTEAERLETLVQERTEALNQANAGLQRSNLNLSQFAYVASHDLQEPLRKIQAFGDMLFKRNAAQLDEPGVERIRRMQDAAERMSGLIKDLLDYSRVSSFSETFAPVDLSEVLKAVRSDLAVAIREKAASLRFDALPVVSGDATQLRQVLQNLVSNALKFTRPGVPPVVEVRCRVVPGAEVKRLSLAPDAFFYEITVSDNGIGFDETYADRIFEAFQRLHGRGEYPGTGIGLAIVRKVLENHHGGVTVRSGVGEGATFRVYLPVG